MIAHRVLSLVCLAALGGCAVNSGAPIQPDGGLADANQGYCDLSLALVSAPGPLAPATLQVAVSVQRVGEVSGIESFTWQAMRDNTQAIPVAPLDQDSREVSIRATDAGTYRVTVTGVVGAISCTSASLNINVGVPGAQRGLFRLRLIPAPGQSAPAQEQIIEIPGGASYDLGAVAMSPGIEVTGMVQAGSGSLSGYVRASPSSEPGARGIEAFADQSGRFDMRVENRSYDVLVVPEDNQIAPRRFASRLPGDFAFTLDAGMAVSGVLMGPAGTAEAGARVAMRVDGVPSTLAVTDAAGAFTLLARPGAMAGLSVVPGRTGLPRLTLSGDPGLAMDSDPGLTIAYDSGLTSRLASGVGVVDATGASVPGARVTWISRPMPGAGTVRADSAAAVALTGSVRVTQVADAAGMLPDTELPEVLYDVIIEPGAAGAVTLTTVDLSAGAPASLILARTARLGGVVVDAAGVALADVRITAAPTGLLALVPGAAASTQSSTDGAFVLDVVARGEYELTLSTTAANHARTHRRVQAPEPDQTLDLGPIALPAALAVTGRVSLWGAGTSAGVTLRLLCHACEGQDPSWPIAEAATSTSGDFTLAVPDPGLGAANRSGAARKRGRVHFEELGSGPKKGSGTFRGTRERPEKGVGYISRSSRAL